MRILGFDTEANGLLPDATVVHCLVVKDYTTGNVHRFNDQRADKESITNGLTYLNTADVLIAHNGIDYDLPLLKKVRGWTPLPGILIKDTLVLSRLMYTNMKERDFAKDKQTRHKWIPTRLFGRHSLESWGYRLGNYKGEFEGPWDKWTPEMEDYCEQDVHVLHTLWNHFAKLGVPAEADAIEHGTAEVIHLQTQRGITFDERRAAELYARLAEKRMHLLADLRARYFGAFYFPTSKVFVPKRDNKKTGYTAGAPLCQLKLVEFNPSSRAHIANRFIKMFGWEPTERTDNGEWKVDDAVLSALPYAPVKLLLEYLEVDKIIGLLAEGKQAWLKLVKDGVLYGSVNPNGAVTGRMTHSKPNIAQTPKPSTSSYGEECRALFGPRKGMVQVGCDAEGLEARNLGHYMARWDGGAYGKAIVEGNKDEGTDVHTVNQRALGLRKRDSAKTWLYAFMYGAGDYKLGTIVIEDMEPEERRKYKTKNAIVALGKRTRQMIAKNIPALAKLVDAVKKRVRDNGKLTGLDGRPLYSRSEHSALNLLLQSAGAVIMKKALVMFHTEAQARGHVVDVDFGYLLNVHDEVQIEAKPEIADELGTLMADCIHKAGEYFHFRCPLAGAWEKGNSWLETH